MVLIIKTMHILGVVLFLGAGIMSAYYKVRADRSGDPRILAWCQAEIVRADWLFTVPSGVIVPITGFLLVHTYGLDWSLRWIHLGIGGFITAGLLWLPAAWLQIQMRAMATDALEQQTDLPRRFHKLNRIWFALGAPAFAIAVGTVWVMVTKWSPG